MAPLVRTTIQLLLGYIQTETPSLHVGKQNTLCHEAHVHGANTPTSNGPSLATISWGYNRLDVYGKDQDSGNVSHKWWDGYQWGPSVGDLELLGGDFDTPPSAVSGNTSKMDIFSIGQNGDLQHKFFDGSSWQPAGAEWDSLKGDLDAKFAPSTTSWAPNRLDVFAKGVDGGLYLKYYDGSSWGPSSGDNEDLGGSLLSGPAAVSWGPDRNDVFAIDTSNGLVHIYWDGSNWSQWENLSVGSSFYATPSVTSWGVGRLDIFAITSGGSLSHLYWDGSQWSGEEDLGGTELTGTVAVTSSPNRLDIVALGSDSQYYYKYYDGTGWQPSVEEWYPKGGSFNSAPSVVSWVQNADQRLDIFGVTTDNQLGHQTWYGSGWYPGSNEWEKLGGPLEAYVRPLAEPSSKEL